MQGSRGLVEVDGITYNLANISMATGAAAEKVRNFTETLGTTLTVTTPFFSSWHERRLYYRRNKWARYQLSNPKKSDTDMVYTNDGRALYGKKPL